MSENQPNQGPKLKTNECCLWLCFPNITGPDLISWNIVNWKEVNLKHGLKLLTGISCVYMDPWEGWMFTSGAPRISSTFMASSVLTPLSRLDDTIKGFMVINSFRMCLWPYLWLTLPKFHWSLMHGSWRKGFQKQEVQYEGKSMHHSYKRHCGMG